MGVEMRLMDYVSQKARKGITPEDVVKIRNVFAKQGVDKSTSLQVINYLRDGIVDRDEWSALVKKFKFGSVAQRVMRRNLVGTFGLAILRKRAASGPLHSVSLKKIKTAKLGMDDLMYLLVHPKSDVRQFAVNALHKKVHNDPRVVSTFICMLEGDDNPDVRARVAGALGSIGGMKARRALEKSAKGDSNEAVRGVALDIISKNEELRNTSVLATVVKNERESAENRRTALKGLYIDESLPLFIKLLGDDEYIMRWTAAKALIEAMPDEKISKVLIEAFNNRKGDRWEVSFRRRNAAWVLGKAKEGQAVSALKVIIKSDGDEDVVSCAVDALVRIMGKKAASILFAVFRNSRHSEVRVGAIRHLAQFKLPGSAKIILQHAEKEKKHDVLCEMVKAFGVLGDRRAIPFIVRSFKAVKADDTERIIYSSSFEDEFRALIQLDAIKALSQLARKHINRGIRAGAVEALGEIKSSKSAYIVFTLRKALKDRFTGVQFTAAESLIAHGKKRIVVPTLMEIAARKDKTHEEYGIRARAIKLLGTLGDSRAIPTLVKLIPVKAAWCYYGGSLDGGCNSNIGELAVASLKKFKDPRAKAALKKAGIVE